ncbi:MAG: hypothetical protein M1827_006907 [Pycnora praestabilis]|nr:MAG: hypothetical protein M1827_006907 [Pycnora praestabilis]
MSSPSAPPRRFLPQPVETTKKSQRRFAPEPVETSTKSNRGTPALAGQNVQGGLGPDPSETTDKESRFTAKQDEKHSSCEKPRTRILPEPIESTTKSNRNGSQTESEHEKPKRRFFPEPIESSTKTSKDKPQQESASSSSDKPRPRFLPEPIESSTKTNRRKFAPQLIETTKRTRKAGDPAPAALVANKVGRTPEDSEQRDRMYNRRLGILPLSPEIMPRSRSPDIAQVHELRRAPADRERETNRRHSFITPSLPTIESSESERSDDSNCPSLSTSPSVSSDGSNELHKHASRMRESCDDRFSGYLLDLAARAAEKQLKEQAMAAYPNSEFHEPVDHFGMDRESDTSSEDDDVGNHLLQRDRDGDMNMLRRDSETEVDWEVQELRKHHENLERVKSKQTNRETELDGMALKGMSHSAEIASKQPFHNDASGAPKRIIGGWQKNIGLDQMRSAASPPMLGSDIKFPSCQSPKQTRLDVHQYPSPLEDVDRRSKEDHSGLWAGNADRNRYDDNGGLWMGLCVPDEKAKPSARNTPTGLLTPAVERDDPFGSLSRPTLPDSYDLPPSPPKSEHASFTKLKGIDSVLIVEAEIDREFSDEFVTQVYNFLSIGYPSLARKFDMELSKISRVPIEELRADDKLVNAKGFVGLDEGNGVDVEGVKNGKCGRWKALKAYVREWARQHPGMIQNEAAPDAWGVRARRGSWAI